MNLWFSMLLPCWLPVVTEFCCERCVLRKEIVNLSSARFRLESATPEASSLSPPPLVRPRSTPTPLSALPPFFASSVSPMNPGPSSDW
uniref:Putative secreted protein n=1 Tax=Anopheles marajoara TaxID=58244 RepID=A0A2M4CAG7_9DIPT